MNDSKTPPQWRARYNERRRQQRTRRKEAREEQARAHVLEMVADFLAEVRNPDLGSGWEAEGALTMEDLHEIANRPDIVDPEAPEIMGVYQVENWMAANDRIRMLAQTPAMYRLFERLRFAMHRHTASDGRPPEL